MPKPHPRSHPAMPARKRCVIYTRISRDDTGIGKANDRQEEMCRAKAMFKDYEIVEVVRDVSVSAYSGKDRPGWQQVLTMAREGHVEVILAYHMDRITRSMRDLEELIDLSVETGVGIDTATGEIELTSDMGRMIARILAAVARQEVERKSARQKLAYEQRAREGLPHSVKTFGYSSDGLEVIEEEAVAIQNAAEDVLEGTAISEIARRWGAAYPPAGGCDEECSLDHRHKKPASRAPLTGNGVRMALINPRYAGIRMYQGENMGLGQWPAILDMETHLALRGLLEDPGRVSGSVRAQGRKSTTLLAGIAHCKVCGTNVNEKPTTRATKAHGTLIYNCRGGGHINTPRKEADGYVLALLCERLAHPDFLHTLAPADDTKFDAARDELAGLRKRKDGLARSFANGLIDEEQLTVGSATLAEQMKAIEGVLAQRPVAAPVRGLSIGTPAIVDEIMELSVERQRALIEAWFTVTFVPRGKGSNKGKSPTMSIKEQVLVDARI